MDDEQRGEPGGGIATGGTAQLRQYLATSENDMQQLLDIVGSYVRNSRLAATSHEEADLTYEIVSVTILRAFDLVEKKYRGQGFFPWLLRIAGYCVKEKRREQTTQHWREPLMGDLLGRARGQMEDGDFFTVVHAFLIESPEQEISERMQLQQAFATLSAEDRKCLVMSIVQEYTHSEMMQHFGLNPSTQRMRCKRALDRLRAAWNALEEQKRGGEDA
jgi:RNA polymerase sigma factor (sigma-70 family)